MRRIAIGFLAVVLMFGFAWPVMAEQEVNGVRGNTVAMVIGGLTIADKDAYCRPYNPLVKVLNAPLAGSNAPIQLQFWDLGYWSENYAYIFLNDQLFTWRTVRNGDIIAVAPGSWSAGTLTVKVVVSTTPRMNLYDYDTNCCEALEVELLTIPVIAPPVCCPSPPPPSCCQAYQPRPCCPSPSPCSCCGFNPLGFILGLFIGLGH